MCQNFRSGDAHEVVIRRVCLYPQNAKREKEGTCTQKAKQTILEVLFWGSFFAPNLQTLCASVWPDVCDECASNVVFRHLMLVSIVLVSNSSS